MNSEAVLDMFQKRAAWLNARCGMFTSSEIYKLLKGGTRAMTKEELAAREKGNRRTTVDTMFGEGAMTYIYEKVNEIITGEVKELEGKKELEWGCMHEPDNVKLTERAIGHKIEYFGIANPQFFSYNEYSGGSPDGLIGERGIHEAKSPYNGTNHAKYLDAMLRLETEEQIKEWFKTEHEDYYAQVQFNLMSTKRDYCVFSSYDPRPVEPSHRLAMFKIDKDEDMQRELAVRLPAAKVIVQQILKRMEAKTPILISGEQIGDNTVLIAQAG